MIPEPGDIVEMLSYAPYQITKPGSRWCVIERILSLDDTTLLQVTEIPDRFEDLAQLQYLAKDSYVTRKIRAQKGIKIFNINPYSCKVISKLGNNNKFKHLLEQGDMWESKSLMKNDSYTVELPWE